MVMLKSELRVTEESFSNTVVEKVKESTSTHLYFAQPVLYFVSAPTILPV
jgi:hypothetical protein